MIKLKNTINEDSSFENKLVQNTSLIVAFGALIASIINFLLGLEIKLVYVPGSAFVVFFLFFVFARYFGKFSVLRWSVPLISSLYINFMWYFNYVSNGPVLTLFVLYYCFLLLIGNKKQIVVYSILTGINLLALFFIEFYRYESLSDYESAKARVINVYSVTFISLIIAFSFIYYAKRNYLAQYLKAKKTDELKSSFLANMSHEIRTPLNAIVGFSSLLAQREYSDEKREKYRSFIDSNSKYLLHLVNDILDISKIESNQMNLVAEEFEVDKLFIQLQEEYSGVIEQQGKNEVDISYKLHEKDLRIYADKYRFEQVIRNFLTNAIKFTYSGHIKYGSYLNHKNIVFFVKDTGAGIAKDDLKLIFSRFTKLNKDSDDLHQGAGLGLFLSKQLANLMGGEVWAESEKGRGSTFYLSIPA